MDGTKVTYVGQYTDFQRTVRTMDAGGRGFTVIELMVTLAVLAVVMTFAIPAFERLMEKMRLVRATQPVHEMLVYAHSEAIKRFRPIVVSFSADGSETWALGITDKGACTATEPDPTDENACTVDPDNNPSTANAVLMRTDSTELPRVTMAAPSFNGVTYTVFEQVRGLPFEGTVDRSGQVVLTTANFETRVQVGGAGSAGNIRICSPSGGSKVSWYPDC